MRASSGTFPSTRSIRETSPNLSNAVLMWKYSSAITHGIGHLVGSVAPEKLADLVLWKPENFGAKPEMVLKSGVIVFAKVSNATAFITRMFGLTIRYCRWEKRMRPFPPSSRPT